MANVKLSIAEIELMNNATIILTKNKIIQEVYNLFGTLANTYSTQVKNSHSLLQEANAVAPKISKGENYEGLPWVMLDYPRYFTKQNTCAIRTFFWWGNFASITLQLNGATAQHLKNKLQQNLSPTSVIDDMPWMLCCNNTQWEHHFREDNYKPLSNFTKTEIEDLQFIKLAKKIPLQEWDNFEYFFTEQFAQLLKLLAS